MTDSTWSRGRLRQHELELSAMRRNLQSPDWVTTIAVLATIDLAEEPQALDLICELVELRAGGAGEVELQGWGARARAYLRLIADQPEAERTLAN